MLLLSYIFKIHKFFVVRDVIMLLDLQIIDYRRKTCINGLSILLVYLFSLFWFFLVVLNIVRIILQPIVLFFSLIGLLRYKIDLVHLYSPYHISSIIFMINLLLRKNLFIIFQTPSSPLSPITRILTYLLSISTTPSSMTSKTILHL